MSSRILGLLGFALFAAAPAAAQVIPIGPFTGDNSDSFETQASQGQSGFTPCMIGRILNNTADMCTPGSSGIHITGGWSFGCQIAPRTGGWLHGTAAGTGTEITFDNPVSQFGAYFGNNSPNAATYTATFFDAGGAVVGSEMFAVPNDCTWYWHGWSIVPCATRATFVNSNFNGAFVMMEDLEATDCGGGGGITVACDPANQHSQGGPVILDNSSLSANGLHVEANAGPAGEFGYLLISAGITQPGSPISNGILCLDAPIGRYAPAAGAALNSIGDFDAAGTWQTPPGSGISGWDVPNTLPSPPGGAIMPGDTWYFQLWFRDGQRSNFSNAICVTF